MTAEADIDYGKFRKSLKRLVEQHENYKNPDSDSKITQEAIAESVIQRFEVCFDCLWKVLRRHLSDALGVAEIPKNPKGIFKTANESDLLTHPVERWLDYVDKRIGTTHDYDETKAQACLEIVENFIGDAGDLYRTMTGEGWR